MNCNSAGKHWQLRRVSTFFSYRAVKNGGKIMVDEYFWCSALMSISFQVRHCHNIYRTLSGCQVEQGTFLCSTNLKYKRHPETSSLESCYET